MDAAISQSGNSPFFRVIKIGGSLFSMPDLQEKIEAWSIKNVTLENSNSVNVWVAGGGAMVEAVRQWQSLHGLDNAAAHRISIDLLSTSAKLFHSLFPDWQTAIDINQLNAVELLEGRNVVLDCSKWADANRSLKAGWETTSDSIALRLAIELNAMELHLLKSASPSSPNIEEALNEGLVDLGFVGHLKDSVQTCIKITNLRNTIEPVRMKIR